MLTTASLLLQCQQVTMEALLFPQPTEHVAHHHRCHQPQQPKSGNNRSSLPSQHKTDCYVKWGKIVDDLLIGSWLLSLLHLSSLPLCLPYQRKEGKDRKRPPAVVDC
jgi:hypothetical protein